MINMKQVFTLIVFVAMAISSFAMQNKKRLADFDSYEKSWTVVEGFEKVGQTASALEEVEAILHHAEIEGNHPQVIKALLYKSKYTMILEEDAEIKIIALLDEHITGTDDPLFLALLHSIKAGALWDYYRANRYKFLGRSSQAVKLNDDFRTWDLRTLMAAIRNEHMAALDQPKVLQSHPVNTFDYILLQQDESEMFRPTVYDLIVHRAIDFFTAFEGGLAEEEDPFSLDNEDYFSPAREFAALDIEERSSTERDVMALLQELIRFRLREANEAALMDADVKRFSYLLANCYLDNKEALYIEALQEVAVRYPENDYTAYINYKIAQQWYNESKKEDKAPPEGDINLRITARDLCNKTIAQFPEAAGTENCRHLLQQLESRELSAKTERVLIPGRKDKIHVRYRNLDQVHFRLVRLTDLEARDLNGMDRDKDKWVKQLADREAVRNWSEGLENTGDLYSHSTEFIMDGLSAGAYYLFASQDGDFREDVSVAGEIWVSDLAYYTRSDAEGRLEIYILDRTSGRPVEGATVRSFFEQYDYQERRYRKVELGITTTGADGLAVVVPKDERNTRNIRFSVEKEGDFLDLRSSEYVSRQVDRKPNWRQQTFYFTDRSIYRPGQTVYFKGISVRTNGEESEILTGENIPVEFRDVNYKEIGRRSFTTNDYGSFHGSFTAPAGGLMGRMTIRGGGGQINIRVEEYKRPTFEVVLDSLEGSYSLGQAVTMSGKGLTYAGAPVVDGKVTYRVERRVRYPYWSGRGWFRHPPMISKAREIAHGEVRTAGNGTFELTFTAEPDRSIGREHDPRFLYTVHVDMVDISGETRSATKTIKAGYTGLDLNVELAAQWDRSEEQIISVKATNLEGREEAAEVVIELYRLPSSGELLRDRLWEEPDIFSIDEAEYRKAFPGDVYKQLNDAQRPRMLLQTYTINTGVTKSITIRPEILSASGEYWVEAHTRDSAGNDIRFMGKVIALSAEEEDPALPVHLSLKTADRSWKPGDTAVVEIASSMEGAYVLYHVSHDGKVRESRSILLSHEIRRIDIPVTEQDRGGLLVQCAVIAGNRSYTGQVPVDVPHESTDLQVEWMTFRDLLKPGQQEEWKLKIKGADGERVQAELLAAMYDKSLDYFTPHGFYFWPAMHPYTRTAKTFNDASNFSVVRNWTMETRRTRADELWQPRYDRLNLFGFSMHRSAYRTYMRSNLTEAEIKKGQPDVEAVMSYADEEAAPSDMAGGAADGLADEDSADPAESAEEIRDEPQISLRENLDETAFFFPQLQTNAAGEIIIRFEMPEALTTWEFLGMAHDRELNSKLFEREAKTQKDLMVTPHFPRFFREGDRITVTARVDNLTEKELDGKVVLILKDAFTGKDIHGRLVEGNENHLVFPAGGSKLATWEIFVNDEFQAITYEIYAVAGDYTDGLRSTLPVLTNRMMVTETMPIWLKGAGTREFTLDHLKTYTSPTIRHHQFTLEYTSNPAWYAVQALPYLMEFPYECSEQLFSRYYANSLAAHIANSSPGIRQVFDQWRSLEPEALLSNLEKNQELKMLLIEETPWLRDAEDETERKKRIALLFDLNRMAADRQAVLQKLKEMQTPNGGFAWFPGMRDNRYITQHIMTGLAHLQQLDAAGVMEDETVRGIIDQAIPYLDARIREDFEHIKKNDSDHRKNDHLASIQIQYLYVRSHFRDYTFDGKSKEAMEYFLDQAEKFWLGKSMYSRAMISIALHGFFKRETAQQIIVSCRENAITDDEKGMYWKSVEQGGYYWYNAPVEAQSMLIEAFHTVADDAGSVNEMKVWLLKQKQVQDWRTTKATAEAVFALLLRGDDWLADTKLATVRVGGQTVDVKAMDGSYEAGTGYFKVKWDKGEVNRDMATVTVTSEKNAPGWGAVYWQYFEDLDKIDRFSGTPLQLDKKIFVESNSSAGPVITPLADYGDIRPGDKLMVRIEITADRNMEFVHMKDMRASGLEPVNVLSEYKYQDGLGYYESTRDAATHFFFDNLPKGVHVFEYPLRVSHAGEFSNGITSIQSMYAPEFASFSEGAKLEMVR
jgi:hypothetical protein